MAVFLLTALSTISKKPQKSGYPEKGWIGTRTMPGENPTARADATPSELGSFLHPHPR
jgi:hypothetical protein